MLVLLFLIREINADEEDEDEVFFGPVGHRERCVTVNSGVQDDEKFKPLSPLNGEQIAELFKEATAVSIFIKNSSLTQNNDNMTDEKENRDICKLLSQTFTVQDDKKAVSAERDLENDQRTTKSASSPESASSISPQSTEFPDDMNFPVTPRRILQESNTQSGVFQSPFKARKARPLQNTSKFAQSKLPTTQMTLKTRSCFNSVSTDCSAVSLMFPNIQNFQNVPTILLKIGSPVTTSTLKAADCFARFKTTVP